MNESPLAETTPVPSTERIRTLVMALENIEPTPWQDAVDPGGKQAAVRKELLSYGSAILPALFEVAAEQNVKQSLADSWLFRLGVNAPEFNVLPFLFEQVNSPSSSPEQVSVAAYLIARIVHRYHQGSNPLPFDFTEALIIGLNKHQGGDYLPLLRLVETAMFQPDRVRQPLVQALYALSKKSPGSFGEPDKAYTLRGQLLQLDWPELRAVYRVLDSRR